MEPERVLGIDFSAAKSDAGRRTWVASAFAAWRAAGGDFEVSEPRDATVTPPSRVTSTCR